ncbi:MAG: DUF167 domain-containing protein [Chloroflexota bacterium]
MIHVTVTVRPGASRESVDLDDRGGLLVRVRARPVEGQANAAVERAVAEALGLRPRQVRVIRGAASRTKTLELDVESAADIAARLGNPP